MLVSWLLKLILQARTKTHSASVQPVVVIIAATCSPRACVCYVRLRHSQRHGFAPSRPRPPDAPFIIPSWMQRCIPHRLPPLARQWVYWGNAYWEWAWDRGSPIRWDDHIGRKRVRGNKGRFGGLRLRIIFTKGISTREQGRLFCGAFLLSLNGSRFPSAAGASLGRIHQTRPTTTTTA